ncbi:hypothetical protein [Bosea psychrotolerans]|uniref:hypothetical protein n=1 Tax=Bosea TaxID=85413 RepID=UPI0011B049E1|nr:hypothetical protein [Bosea psychrotolerans]
MASLALVQRLEAALALRGQNGLLITLTDVELAYELAYLRVFVAWESFLEEAFLRLMCGYEHSAGQEPLLPGSAYHSKISDAEAALLNGRQYVLWHNVSSVIGRAAGNFRNSRFENILASAQQRLAHFGAIRHRIAHEQKDGAQKFNAATMALAGKRYRAARPGRFLRDAQANAIPQTRWMSQVCAELEALAQQICI